MLKPKYIKFFEKRSCIYKVKHKTLQDGLQILLKERSKGKTVNNLYKCPFCKYYHIGHYPKKRNRIKNIIKILSKE